MDYLFEQLGPEPFQQLCQALLVKDYPDLQCFPVGQPDGGRDAFSRGDGQLPAVVAQVKYKRADEEDNSDWMIEALKGELSKIQRLHERGAERYLMMTNASGTAHPDKGRIDKAQAWLDENSPIPGQVLWRDDLSRRLDDRNDLKLTYPGLLTGANALTMIYEAILAPKKAQVATIIRLFVAEQYRRDAEVKFRQVDLSNTLNALFVDVPVDLYSLVYSVERNMRQGRREVVARLNRLVHAARIRTHFDRARQFDGYMQTAGTADLLLSAEMHDIAPRVVLQGAPGQGKSTIAQYVCQVHRARLLDKADFLENMPELHKDAPFRLPVKVDLRDLAGFIDGREYLQHSPEESESSRTFERFLANLIAIHSGSDSFSVDDLRDVLQGSPSLIFLDGLDEVADNDLRERMLERVNQGLNRLHELGANLQVVITSRPAQLGQAAKLPDDFTRLNMAPLDIEVVRRYAEKWTVAKGLDNLRTSEVMTILDTKLGLEHIRELTKNPMQLTILLTLIHQIGHSLPDARTDLYRAYVDLFMTREAEKDAVVRAHKGLLLQIVEYLAWELQSQAEAEGSSGSISSSDLRALVRNYLRRTNRDETILAELFERGLDRIYVLVQRIEGLYEFEVQPLREYFAAKYLYSTAPMQTRWGQVVKGDRLQRFEAIASNPYWANVTRFYAGFWEQGEVLALSGSLREMIADGTLELSVNARAIGSALLTDRAFAAKPFVQHEVIDAIFDPIGVNLSALSRLNDLEPLVLAKECGRDHFAELIFRNHIEKADQVLAAVCHMLRRNGGVTLKTVFDGWVSSATGALRSRRLGVAALCGALDSHDPEELLRLIEGDGCESETELARRRQRLYGGLDSIAGNDVRIAGPTLDDIRRYGGFGCYSIRNEVTALAAHVYLPRVYMYDRDDIEMVLAPEVGQGILDFIETTQLPHGATGDESTVTPVQALVDAIGTCWASYRFALGYEGQLDGKRSLVSGDVDYVPLSDRVGRARRWRGRSDWWAARLGDSEGVEKRFWVAAAIGWAPSAQVENALGYLEEAVTELDESDVSAIEDVLVGLESQRAARNGRRRAAVKVVAGVSDRLGRLLVLGFGPAQVDFLPRSVKSSASFSDFAEQAKVRETLESFPGWDEVKPRSVKRWLETLRLSRKRQSGIPDNVDRRILNPRAFPVAAANEVIGAAKQYDPEVVSVAVAALQLSHKPAPVRTVAAQAEWEF